MNPTHEKSLIIIKPDAVQRNLIGEIIGRVEKKGLKIIGTKMMSIEDAVLEEHYAHIKDKPFFPGIIISSKTKSYFVLLFFNG